MIAEGAWSHLTAQTEANRTQFYVYKDADSGFNHGYPSGFFGAMGKIDLDAACGERNKSPHACRWTSPFVDTARGPA